MKKLLFLFLLLCGANALRAQQIIPYSYYQYQKLNKSLYSIHTRFHTSLKPVITDDTVVSRQLDSLLAVGTETARNTWIGRKLFNEHFVQIEKDDYTFYLDILGDFQIGRDVEHRITTWNNMKGFQLGGTIGKRFSFYASAFENQARFPEYQSNYIDNKGLVFGMAYDKSGPGKATKDWAYSTAVLNYNASKFFTFTLGHDKNFVGDGYRSMLFSDVSAAYPFFKVTTTLGNVKYVAMWSQFQDLIAPKFSYDNGYRKKWGVFHFIDWNVNNRLSLGFFDSIIWQDADEEGKRGFDVSYLNPIIFLRPIEGSNGSPDNAFLGFTGKYKLFSNLTLYGQFLADEFTAKEVFAGNGYWANKFGYQLGVKGFDAFKVPGLNYLAEFNTARPFTYSQRSSLLNYGNYNEALAHPMGANFREFVTLWNYQFKKWAFSAQANYANYGLNNGENVGKNIYESYETRARQHGYKTGDGLKTDFMYLDGRVAYIINPKYNLRLEIGGIFRKETNNLANDKTTMVTFGLRTTFRNIYQDF